MGDKIRLARNADALRTLPFGSPEEVAADVKKCVRATVLGGGYILASSNTLIRGFPVENIYTMYKIAQKYGLCPLRGET